jgi:RNA polymerase sigma-70 factor (ECF subfamily)
MILMDTGNDPDTQELLDRARTGNPEARQQLLMRHRKRLREMVGLRMDRRLIARVDPSDVVQEALAEAVQQLSNYLRDRPLPFYPWLRQLAWERLIELHRRHLYAQKRSVRREDREYLALPDDSAVHLAQRLLAPGSSPSERVLRQELRDRVQTALAQLSPRDREILVLRHLEELSTNETAAVLGITAGAVKMQHLRAVRRLRGLLGENFAEK